MEILYVLRDILTNRYYSQHRGYDNYLTPEIDDAITFTSEDSAMSHMKKEYYEHEDELFKDRCFVIDKIFKFD